MKRIVASVVLTGLLVPAFAFAQDTGTTQPVRPTPPPEVRKEIEVRKQQVQERREEVREKVETKREEIKNEVKTRVETRKAEIDAKRDEVKQKVEDRREDVKEKVAEKRGERQDNRLQNVKTSFERMAKVFDATLARLTTLKDRLYSRMGELQDKGVNVTASKSALGNVETALAKSKAEIDTFRATIAALVVPTTTGSTTAKLDLTNVRKDASDVQASFKESRIALEAAVKAIKSDARAANVSADNE